MKEKIVIEKPIIVEGKYDKIKLAAFVEGTVIVVNGFSIFTDLPLQKMIKELSGQTQLILLLDSDAAGFKIRGFLHSILPKSQIVDVYIPDIEGKEKRKTSYSKEGKLGVEGLREQLLCELLASHATVKTTTGATLNKRDFIRLGLSGMPNSALLRKKLYKKLNLPEHISTKNAAEILGRTTTLEEFEAVVEQIKNTL